MTDIMQLTNTKATETALVIQPGIEFDKWEEIGTHLGRVNQGLMWWVGDWINYGEAAYGEKYAQAIDATGKSYATVKQASYMSRKYPAEVRKSALTFSHYGVVAGLDDDLSDRLLSLAEEHKWTVKELKANRDKMEEEAGVKPPKDPVLVCCPACGAEFPANEFKSKDAPQ